MIMDEEVFAVLLAVTIVASVIGVALVIRPDVPEPFMAIGLLGENCKIGNYPRAVTNSSQVDLCMFVANYMGRPVLYKVVYKVGDRETLPTNTTPSPRDVILLWMGVLGNKENVTRPVIVPVVVHGPGAREVALIFELWVYDTSISDFAYSGKWVHYYVNVTYAPTIGGIP